MQFLGFSVFIVIVLTGAVKDVCSFRLHHNDDSQVTALPGPAAILANKCPEAQAIAPCTCNSNGLACIGESIKQEHINALFRELRQVNNVSESQQLYTTKFFSLLSTPMKEFDVTPLLKSRFTYLTFYLNYDLTRIFGPLSTSNGGEGKDESIIGSIETTEMIVPLNGLTDEGLADFFPYFNPETFTSLTLELNQIHGPNPKNGEKISEFLPGLNSLTNLQSLAFADDKIEGLEGPAFKNLGRLTQLYFNSQHNGGLKTIGESAFLMDDANAPERRKITLWGNALNDESFHANHGLQFYKGETNLAIGLNKFEFLSREKFQPFLDVNPRNSMDCRDNQFVCDERMSWLKAGRDEYEKRVLYVDCVNQPGFSIFNTTLV